MRSHVGLLAGLLVAAIATSASAMPVAPSGNAGPIRIDYFCSDGFAPRGGRCIATASRDEIELFDVDPYVTAIGRHRHRRHGLRTRY